MSDTTECSLLTQIRDSLAAGGSSAVTEYTEDAALPADPAGGALIARRKDTLSGSEVSATGDAIAVNATSKGELHTKNTDLETLTGAVTETAPATDTASSGLNGRLQRIAQRLTSLTALLPTALGGTTSANSLPVVLSSDGPFAVQTGSITETAPATDTASSGLNGRLQRIAQRLPTLSVVNLTPVLDTSAYVDGDILFDTIVMASSFLSTTGVNRLDSFHVLDEDDQGVAFDIVLLNALTSLGTINVAASISDANARNILGFFSVATSDYIDLGTSRIATVRNIGIDITTGATSLWVAGITRGGTPTYTASGMKMKFGFTQIQT